MTTTRAVRLLLLPALLFLILFQYALTKQAARKGVWGGGGCLSLRACCACSTGAMLPTQRRSGELPPAPPCSSPPVPFLSVLFFSENSALCRVHGCRECLLVAYGCVRRTRAVAVCGCCKKQVWGRCVRVEISQRGGNRIGR
jgi:hypothetical protein